MTDPDQTKVVAELLKLEQERCRAISEQDWPALTALIASPYSHVHATGRTEDRDVYLAGIQGRPRKTTRGELEVRVYGDAAVMTGPMTNHMESPAGTTLMETVATQTWVREHGTWKLAAIQVTRLAE
jgi:ketosteroid isomerase-like protein